MKIFPKRILKNLSFLKIAESLLIAFGALWLIFEILVFFNNQNFANQLKSFWWAFILIGIIYTLIKNWPQNKYIIKVKNRDASISILIEDFFKVDGAKIIPVNNQLNLEFNSIIKNSNSIQRHFVESIYNSQDQHLITDVNNHISDNIEYYDQLKIADDIKQYKIGTVVPIFQNEVQYYLLCNSTLNNNGRSNCTKSDFRNSISELWAYLIHFGSKEHLVIPVLGTGKGRITLTREEVIKEIVLSFLASLGESNYCDRLTICIHPSDINRYNLDMEELRDFIKLNCENTNFTVEQGRGVPIGREVN